MKERETNKHKILVRLVRLVIIVVAIFYLIASISIPAGHDSQRSYYENRCKERLKQLVLYCNESFSVSDLVSESSGIIQNKGSGFPQGMQDDVIENYIIFYCLDDLSIPEKEQDGGFHQSYTILAVPDNNINFRVLYFIIVNQPSKLRTFAINQDSEIFYKIGDPVELTCDDINLRSKDEWAQIPTE